MIPTNCLIFSVEKLVKKHHMEARTLAERKYIDIGATNPIMKEIVRELLEREKSRMKNRTRVSAMK